MSVQRYNKREVCEFADATLWVRADDHVDEIVQLDYVNKKLRTALEAIVKHQELVGAKIGTRGTTWLIASNALKIGE